MKLLTTGNPKIAKGEKLGYLTNILHLAPSDMSGRNVCPMATAGCKAACLNTAGRGGLFAGQSHLNMTGAQLVTAVKSGSFVNVIQSARIARTEYFFASRGTFMAQLYREIASAIKLAKRHKLTPVFRLNGTSDLRWETFGFDVFDAKSKTVTHYKNMMTAFPDVQFYDYTKIPNRRDLPANYHLTFSLAEDNNVQAQTALDNGLNVAAVFFTVPETYLDLPVINGDESDLRFLDPKGVIVGLKAKGKAKKDTSGFVK
jgi:hypothetical protein